MAEVIAQEEVMAGDEEEEEAQAGLEKLEVNLVVRMAGVKGWAVQAAMDAGGGMAATEDNTGMAERKEAAVAVLAVREAPAGQAEWAA